MMITVSLDPKQVDALFALVDAGVKATGLQSVHAASQLLAHFQAAAEEAQSAQAEAHESATQAANGALKKEAAEAAARIDAMTAHAHPVSADT